MNNPGKLLTIVVPSYNTEKYIDRCIPTMLRHRMRQELELLLVNDGSSDRTLPKLLAFAQTYPGTVRVIDKTNGGHGSVINTGIREARGKYFKVVDGDDQVDSRNLERLLCCLRQMDADLVVNPYVVRNMQTGRKKTVRYHAAACQELDFDQDAAGIREIGIHAATYRTQLLRDNHIRVRENCFYEDTEYNLYPVCYVKDVCILDFPVYVYHTGTAGQSVSPQNAYRNRKMHQVVIRDCCSYYMRNTGLPGPKRVYMERIICKRILSQYLIYLKNMQIPAASGGRQMAADRRELQQWDQWLKEKFPYFYAQTNHFPISWLRTRRRVCYLSIYSMYFLYSKAMKWNLAYRVPGFGRRKDQQI